jgi:hypothetical protein
LTRKDAREGNSAIANHIETLKEDWDKKKKKALRMMKVDAEVNGVPLTSLNPKTYGLGEDPMKELLHSPEHKREAAYVRMAACAQQIQNLLKTLNLGTSRRLEEDVPMKLEEQVDATKHNIKIHTSAVKEVQAYKMKKLGAATEAAVDKKIINYLERAAATESKEESSLEKKMDKEKKLTEEESFGVAGSPVLTTLDKLKKSAQLLDNTFLPVMTQAKQMSKIAATSLKVMNEENVLGTEAPKSAYKFYKLQKQFKVCANKLRLIIPLSITFDNQYNVIKTTVSSEQTKLEQALKTDAARRLNVALQSPSFMRETKEYRAEAALGHEGVLLAKRVQAVADNPGVGWMSVSQGGTALEEELFPDADASIPNDHSFLAEPEALGWSDSSVFGAGFGAGLCTICAVAASRKLKH